MKKITKLMLGMLLCQSAIAQKTANIYSIVPQQACIGTEVKVFYILSPSSTIKDSINFSIAGLNDSLTLPKIPYTSTATGYVIDGSVGSYVAMSVYTFTMPAFDNAGTISVHADSSAGSFGYQKCAVGIQEIYLNPHESDPLFYNLNGQQVGKRPGELLIEWTGQWGKKIIINN